MTTILYGSSDDLVEVDGDFYDELNDTASDVLFMVDGWSLVAHIEYGGLWNIRILSGADNWDYTLYSAGTPRAVDLSRNDYSDVLVINESVDEAFFGERVEVNTRDR